MSDLICELVKEDDPFLREVPDIFDFDSPQVDPEKLEKQLLENMLFIVVMVCLPIKSGFLLLHLQ